MSAPSKEVLQKVYGETEVSAKRFEHISKEFEAKYGKSEMEFFTAPGRTEIVGNHTDHNGGKVLAGSITLDTIGAAAPNGTNMIHIQSEGYKEVVIDIDKLDEVPKEQGTLSLVAGMVKAVIEKGFNVGGFDVYATTEVISAAGVSSSASFEMLIVSIINYFFNDEKIDFADYARIGQYAENKFWNKASGLMDQMACAVGGPIMLDFSGDVTYRKVDFDFARYGYNLVIVNTGKGHADLSDAYSEIPAEMKEVAKYFGKELMWQVSIDELMDKLLDVRATVDNDRALLRAIHFLKENGRVEDIEKAVNAGDGDGVLKAINESGRSSWELLQNVYPVTAYKEQPIALALALTERFMEQKGRGVCRIHGGGFAGVIAAIVATEDTDEYVKYISKYFGDENVYPMQIRAVGAAHL